METITIKFGIPGMEISIDNRWELANIIYHALRDHGSWVGCKHAEDTCIIETKGGGRGLAPGYR